MTCGGETFLRRHLIEIPATPKQQISVTLITHVHFSEKSGIFFFFEKREASTKDAPPPVEASLPPWQALHHMVRASLVGGPFTFLNFFFKKRRGGVLGRCLTMWWSACQREKVESRDGNGSDSGRVEHHPHPPPAIVYSTRIHPSVNHRVKQMGRVLNG